MLRIRKLALLFLLHTMYLNQAGASLGGSLSSIETDRKAFEGKLSEITAPAVDHGPEKFTEHLIRQDGMEIREYAIPDGTVFAVTWRGPAQPDLSVLLGNYFDEYQERVSQLERSNNGRTAQRRGRSSRVIRSKNMVIEHSGHMRDVRGKAYLPKLMPNGVRPEDLHG